MVEIHAFQGSLRSAKDWCLTGHLKGVFGCNCGLCTRSRLFSGLWNIPLVLWRSTVDVATQGACSPGAPWHKSFRDTAACQDLPSSSFAY